MMHQNARKYFVNIIKEEGVNLIGFREVPRNNSVIGEISRAAEPEIIQILLGADIPQEDLERKLYIIRKRTENAIRNSDIKQKELLLYSKSFNKSTCI